MAGTDRTRGHAREERSPVPNELVATIEHRLAELRPLHDEYTHLMSYRRLIEAAPGGAPRAVRATSGAARSAVLAALSDGPRTHGELARQLPVTPASLRYNLRRLARQGLIIETDEDGSPSYSLAPPAPDGK